MSKAGERINIAHLDDKLIDEVAQEAWARAGAMSGTRFEKDWDKAADVLSSRRGWITRGQFGDLDWALNKRKDLQEKFRKAIFSRIETKKIFQELGT